MKSRSSKQPNAEKPVVIDHDHHQGLLAAPSPRTPPYPAQAPSFPEWCPCPQGVASLQAWQASGGPGGSPPPTSHPTSPGLRLSLPPLPGLGATSSAGDGVCGVCKPRLPGRQSYKKPTQEAGPPLLPSFPNLFCSLSLLPWLLVRLSFPLISLSTHLLTLWLTLAISPECSERGPGFCGCPKWSGRHCPLGSAAQTA